MRSLILLSLCAILASCSSTGLKEAETVFHDGTAAENTALEITKIELASGSKITKIKVAKDQQNLLRYLAMIRGTPALIQAGGEATTDAVNALSDALD